MERTGLGGQTFHCRPRVLIVENDPASRRDHVKNLTDWNYDVLVAEGRGPALLVDARAKAARHRPHLAIVDMRLVDDQDRGDTSGLDLVADLAPTIPLVVSAFGDTATVRQALKKQGAEDFVGKEEGPLRLRQAIQEALASRCHCELHIEWCSADDSDAILAHLMPEDPAIPVDELPCVVARLYAGDRDHDMLSRLQLDSIAEYYRSPQTRVLPVRSMVFVARAQERDGRWHQPEIVKLARREHIEVELDNYREHVAPFLPAQRTARIEDRTNAVTLWDLGGVRYTNIAIGDRIPLSHWYGTVPGTSVVAALDDLWHATLQFWYRMVGSEENGNVYDYYLAQFEKLCARISACPDRGTISLPGVPGELLDPVSWARSHAGQARFASYWHTYTHGDLHGDNVFVDPHSQTYVIDYERSGPGYCLRDAVELEADIRLRLLPLAHTDLALARKLDDLLLAPSRPDEQPRWESLAGDALDTGLRKAFDAITRLRSLARAAGHLRRMDEYYWALLMETLISVLRNYASWEDQVAARLAADRANLSAALLCERLDGWVDPAC